MLNQFLVFKFCAFEHLCLQRHQVPDATSGTAFWELLASSFAFSISIATVSALEGKECQASVKMVAESANLSDEQLAVLLSGMYALLREALRLPPSSLKQEVSIPV